MPMHDWTRVDAGIYHDFHHEWISEIKRYLNRGLLPKDHYAMAEQIAGGFGPDVLTLQERSPKPDRSGGTATLTRPSAKHFAERAISDKARRLSRTVIRHVSDDRVVAVIEIVSPGNKSSATGMRAFTAKACELLNSGVHLILLDPFPPGPRDPNGIHGEVWQELSGEIFRLPADSPLTLVSYESGDYQRAYIETLAVGQVLPELPLYLAPDFYVTLQLEATYQSAWEMVPARWQEVIAPA